MIMLKEGENMVGFKSEMLESRVNTPFK